MLFSAWPYSTPLRSLAMSQASKKPIVCHHTQPPMHLTYGILAPAQNVLAHRNVVFTSGFDAEQTIYQGPSTPERDKAWEDLYNCASRTPPPQLLMLTPLRAKVGISRIPRSSAAKLVNKTVPIPDDPGYYVISLNVFHQLHCVVSCIPSLPKFGLKFSRICYASESGRRKRLHLTTS
jgi:hypothetical protein